MLPNAPWGHVVSDPTYQYNALTEDTKCHNEEHPITTIEAGIHWVSQI